MKNTLFFILTALMFLLSNCNAAEKSTATTEEEWPASANIDGINIKLGKFSFNVPSRELLSLDINDNLPVVAKYKDEKLGLTHETVASMNHRFESDIFSKTKLKLIDYPRMLFFDLSLTRGISEDDKKLIELVATEKKIRFDGATNLKIYKKNNLIAYLAKTDFFSFNYELFLVSEQLPNEFLRISGSNADERTMEYIVTTFQILNNEKSE